MTTLGQRPDDSLLFVRRHRVGSAEIADPLAGHSPSQMARSGVTMFHLTGPRHAKTFGDPLVGLHFRHFLTIL